MSDGDGTQSQPDPGQQPPAQPDPGQQTGENIEQLRQAVASWKGRAERLQRQMDEQRQNHQAQVEGLMERLLATEVRAAGAGKLQKAEDAERFLDLSQFKPNDQGAFDQQAIAAAIDALLRDRPYLGIPQQPSEPPAPPPLPGNGSQQGAQQPGDMNALLRRAAGRA